jgi:PhzF family phenazine biosynthesis protein
MLQEPPEFGVELDPGEVLPLVGLEEDDADPELPVRVVSTGAPMVIAPVRDEGRLTRLLPAHDRIGGLLSGHSAIVLYVAAVDASAGTARARSFAGPEVGEDPATGAAAGPLMAHAADRMGVERLDIVQGVEMGRPSLLRAAVEGDRCASAGTWSSWSTARSTWTTDRHRPARGYSRGPVLPKLRAGRQAP